MGKGGRYVRLTTLPPSCAVVMQSGNRNFLESSGLLLACNGTALPFFYSVKTNISNFTLFFEIEIFMPLDSGVPMSLILSVSKCC